MRTVRPAETAVQLRRDATTPRLRVLFPLGLVLLSLLCLALGPLFVQRRVAELRRQLTDVIDPAETHVTELQLALAREVASVRGYLLTGDARYARAYREARAERDLAFTGLLPLARLADPRVAAEAVRLRAELGEHARQDSLVQGLLGREAGRLDLDRQQQRFEAAIAAAAHLDQAITQVAMRRRAEILSMGRTGSVLTFLSAIFALLAALLVARLGRGYRALALRLDEQVREQIALREELRGSEERFRQTLDSFGEPFFTVDRQWRITYLNRRANEVLRAMMKRPRADLMGHNLWEAMPELEGTEFAEVHRRAMAEHRAIGSEAYFEPWGRWFEVHDFPWEQGLSVFFQDVTERKHDEEERAALLAEMEQKHHELERVMESRARLIRGFSHDLKNPLGAADGFAQLLEAGILGDLEPRQREGIARIRSSLQTTLKLIENLLELARTEAGQIELHCEPTDVARVASEVAEDHRAQATAAGLAMEIRTAGEALWTETDPVRVHQVLGNLVGNAVKYTDRGRVSVAAEERAQGPGAGRWIAVVVSDTGPGIPVAMYEQVFDEFERLEPGTTQGAGIGLAISRRIARLLGGDITVESQMGLGSTFTFWLPLTPVAQPPAPQLPD